MYHLHVGKKRKSLVSGCVTGLRRRIFSFFLLICETMSKCSRNCWIDWNSATLCFKWLFHIHVVWLFAWFVQPLFGAILCVWEIWSGSNNRLAPKEITQNKSRSPHQFWSRPMTTNWRLFFRALPKKKPWNIKVRICLAEQLILTYSLCHSLCHSPHSEQRDCRTSEHQASHIGPGRKTRKMVTLHTCWPERLRKDNRQGRGGLTRRHYYYYYY